MRATDRTEREALNDAGFRIRAVGQELKSQGIDPKGKVSYDVFMASMDTIRQALGELSQRISALEAAAAKPRPPSMVYAGEWIPRYEYDSGNVVEYDNGLWVAVQPTNDGQPPQRGNGWVRLVQGANP